MLFPLKKSKARDQQLASLTRIKVAPYPGLRLPQNQSDAFMSLLTATRGSGFFISNGRLLSETEGERQMDVTVSSAMYPQTLLRH